VCVFFNSPACLRKEEKLNLTSVPSPELKKKNPLCNSRRFRKEPYRFAQCLMLLLRGHVGDTRCDSFLLSLQKHGFCYRALGTRVNSSLSSYGQGR
jgi:hypothetical protein